MKLPSRLLFVLAVPAVLAGCKSSGDIVVDEGVGITAVRGACPAVGVPDYTGDVTLFRTPGASDSASIDIVAAMTNVRSQCNETGGERVYSATTFDVLARRIRGTERHRQ